MLERQRQQRERHRIRQKPDNFRSASSTNSTYVVWYNQFDIWRHWICSVMLPMCTVGCLNLLNSTFQMAVACQLFEPRSNFCILISFEQGALWVCMTSISTKTVFEASSSVRARLLADISGGIWPRHRASRVSSSLVLFLFLGIHNDIRSVQPRVLFIIGHAQVVLSSLSF